MLMPEADRFPRMWGRWDEGPFFVEADGVTKEAARQALESLAEFAPEVLAHEGLRLVLRHPEPVWREVWDCPIGPDGERACSDLNCGHRRRVQVWEFALEDFPELHEAVEAALEGIDPFAEGR